MKTLGKILVVIAVVLLALGLVCAAIGYFTGGSVERMIELFFGSRETFLETVKLLWSQLREQILGLF